MNRTSAEALPDPFPGQRIAAGTGPAWDNLLVHIHARPGMKFEQLVPAVPEPHIVWLMEGEIHLEEREIGGEWSSVEVRPGDLFLTTSSEPYEVRWHNVGPALAVTMQVYVGLPLLAEASRDLLGSEAVTPTIREFSGARDETMLALLKQLRLELVDRAPASSLFVQSIARSLAVHLVRTYGDSARPRAQRRNGLTAFHISEIDRFLQGNLDENFHLADLAQLVGLSEFHFSRLFKKSTGLSPTRYFLRMRIAEARRLLRETERSVLDISLDVGYASASHFTEVFRRETGVTPSEYRNQL